MENSIVIRLQQVKVRSDCHCDRLFLSAMDVQMMEDQGGASHEEKFRVYNDALVHAATCLESKCEAHNGRCHKVKASIDHFVRCYGPRRKISPIER